MPTNRSINPHAKRSGPTAAMGFVIAALVVALIAIPAIFFFVTKGDQVFTVTDKAIKRTAATKDNPGSDVYLIYTDKGTFKNSDTIFALKFNSSDLYGKLKVGVKYDCDVSGLRIPFTSSYKNLLDCKPTN